MSLHDLLRSTRCSVWFYRHTRCCCCLAQLLIRFDVNSFHRSIVSGPVLVEQGTSLSSAIMKVYDHRHRSLLVANRLSNPSVDDLFEQGLRRQNTEILAEYCVPPKTCRALGTYPFKINRNFIAAPTCHILLRVQYTSSMLWYMVYGSQTTQSEAPCISTKQPDDVLPELRWYLLTRRIPRIHAQITINMFDIRSHDVETDTRWTCVGCMHVVLGKGVILFTDDYRADLHTTNITRHGSSPIYLKIPNHLQAWRAVSWSATN